jgi:hypothetical protein
MPSPLAKAQAGDFRKIHRDVDTYFTFSGSQVPCTFGSVEDDFDLSVDGGGEMPVYDFTATCLIADLPGGVIPQVGEGAIIDGVSYQIEHPERIPGSALVKLRFSNLDQT